MEHRGSTYHLIYMYVYIYIYIYICVCVYIWIYSLYLAPRLRVPLHRHALTVTSLHLEHNKLEEGAGQALAEALRSLV